MADETRMDPAPGVSPVPMAGGTRQGTRPAEIDVTRRGATSAAGASLTDDPEAARAEIEQTRRRMSTTIDELGDVLLRKKGQIQERLDVMAPVREHPLRTAGIVFGAGLALGLLTGGGDEEEEEEKEKHHRVRRHGGSDAHWRERSGMWESRARRLLRIAREQDDELEELRGSHGHDGSHRARFADDREHGPRHGARQEHRHDEDEGIFDDLRQTIATGVSGFLGNALRQLTHAVKE